MAKRMKVGYDIGVNSIKIAVAEGADFRLEEERLPEKLVDEEGISSPNAFSLFLRETRKKYRIPRGAAALSLPPGQSICRFVTMPQMTAGQLAMNLPYEFADFIQGDAGQYFFDYALCDPQSGEEGLLPMMAAMGKKSCLEGYVRMFARAGVKLTTILPPEMALVALARESEDRDVCFVDLGQRQTRVTVVRGDRIQATREIPVGCADIDRAIGAEAGVEPFLANTYKSMNYQDVLGLLSVRDICDRIAVELLKVVNFYRFTYQDSELRGVYLVGGGAALPPLREAVAETLDTALLSLAELLGEEAQAYIFAVGAALGGGR